MTSTIARTFVDTNVWVYAVDGADPAKQARAQAVLASRDFDVVVSSQVLSEFYVTVTRKRETRVTEADARRMLERMRRLPVVAIGAEHIVEAAESSQEWQVSYWDALIVVAASFAGCNRVLTEDLADGQTYGHVRVEDPFRPPRRMSERANHTYGDQETTVQRWGDDELLAELGRYEQEATAARMKPNAVHSYWDYARRFLDWRTGDYVPRGVPRSGRPVPPTRASAEELADQAGIYEGFLQKAGLSQSAIDTYYRHAMFFVRWLRGEFRPGGRLR